MTTFKSSSPARTWFAIDVHAKPKAREAVEYGLMEAGALGTETRQDQNSQLIVSAYFDAATEPERVRAALDEALRIYELSASSVREMTVREVQDEDWLSEWKKTWQPVIVGERFIIVPPWIDI